MGMSDDYETALAFGATEIRGGIGDFRGALGRLRERLDEGFAGTAVIDGAAAGQRDDIAGAAGARYPFAELDIADLAPLDGAHCRLDPGGVEVARYLAADGLRPDDKGFAVGM